MCDASERELRELLSRARLHACGEYPFLSPAFWGVRLVIADAVMLDGNIAVATPTGVVIFAREALSKVAHHEGIVPMLSELLYHEVSHIVRGHADRRGERDIDRWNIAADLEVNDDINAPLLNSLIELVIGQGARCVTADMFGLPYHLPAEDYYERLSGIKVMRVFVGCGRCGSAAGNEPTQAERQYWDEGGFIDKSSREILAREVARNIQRYGQKRRGKLPLGWERWAEDILKPPKVRWQDVLRTSIGLELNRMALPTDITYRRPPRRDSVPYLPRPILPSFIGYSADRIAIIVDTSGSISDDELSAFLREVRGIVTSLGMPVWVFSVDAAVHAVRMVWRAEQLKGSILGGGGTNMVVGLEEAAKRGFPIVVIMTDGYTPFPEPDHHALRGRKVIWLIVGDAKVPDGIGQVIRIDE